MFLKIIGATNGRALEMISPELNRTQFDIDFFRDETAVWNVRNIIMRSIPIKEYALDR